MHATNSVLQEASTTAHFILPLNSFWERSENWLMPYLADCGAVENEFRCTCRSVAFCRNTNNTSAVVVHQQLQLQPSQTTAAAETLTAGQKKRKCMWNMLKHNAKQNYLLYKIMYLILHVRQHCLEIIRIITMISDITEVSIY